MKITAAKADSFVNNLPANILAALIYGPDTGLVSQRAEVIAKQIVSDISDPFCVTDISAAKIKEEPAIVADEMAAIGLMGGRRLVRLRDTPPGFSTTLAGIIKDAPDDIEKQAFLLIVAGDLAPSSGLRKLFEKEQNLAAIPCYQDDARSIRTVIAGELRKHNIQCDHDAITFLAENCLGDRMVVIREIEKLSLYMGRPTESSSRSASLDDIIACIGETTESSLDGICNAVANGNHLQLDLSLKKASMQGIVPIAILRAVQRYFMRIHLVVGMVAQGMAQEQAMGTLRPPVFFKQMPAFKAHISRWAIAHKQALWQVMNLIYQAEFECKQTGANPELICGRYLMRIASTWKSANKFGCS